VEEMEKLEKDVDRPEKTRKHLKETGRDWKKTEDDKTRLEED